MVRFLGSYAYLVETFEKANSDLLWTPIPDSVLRVPISTPTFSQTELNTIRQYKENHLKMRDVVPSITPKHVCAAGVFVQLIFVRNLPVSKTSVLATG